MGSCAGDVSLWEAERMWLCHCRLKSTSRAYRRFSMARRFILVLAVASLAGPLVAQERLDPQIGAKIRQEEDQHSQIMRTLHFLTDVYGPRLTGSPSLKAAGEWSIKTMASWGFTNGHLEPW